MGQMRSKVSLKYEERDFWRDFLGQYCALLKSTSIQLRRDVLNLKRLQNLVQVPDLCLVGANPKLFMTRSESFELVSENQIG